MRRQHAGLAQDLEPVADAQYRPAVLGEALHRRHDRAEPRDRAGTEIIAVAEAAGEHDRVGTLEIGVPMPDEVRFGAGQGSRAERIEVTVAAGEPDHRYAMHQPSTSTR